MEDSRSSQTAAEQSTPHTLRTRPAPCIPALAPSSLSISPSLSLFFLFFFLPASGTGWGQKREPRAVGRLAQRSHLETSGSASVPGSESGSTRFHRELAPLLPSPSSAVTTQGARNRNRRRIKKKKKK